jgi:phage-related protein
LGFRVDDGELKKFTALIDDAKATIGAFISSLQIKPSIDDSSVQQFGEAIDTAQAKTKALSDQVIVSPEVDDTSLKQFEKTVDDVAYNMDILENGIIITPKADDGPVRELGDEVDRTKAKADALGSTNIKPDADSSPVRGLGDEVDKTKAKADSLHGKKIKPETDTKPVENLGKAVDSTRQKTESLTAAFLKANLIMKAASRAMGAAIGFIRDSVIGTTAETERFRVVIGNMIGDQEKANEVIHKLDYSPVSDFYGTAAAIGGLRSFVTMGMDIEKARDQMTLLGDVAQGNSESFASLSNTMAMVYSSGKADAMRLKQFMNQGFDVAGALGLTEKQREAGVTYAQVEEALKRVTAAGGPYNNMLEKQMNTLGGLIKRFNSLKAATAEAIGLGINEELKGILKYILQIGKDGQEKFANVFIKAIKEVIHWIWQIIIMWKVLGFRIADMGDALAPVKGFFASLRDVAGDVLTGIMKLVVALGKGFLALAVPISAFLTPIIQALGKVVKNNLTKIGELIDEITPAFFEWAPIFEAIGKTIGRAFEKIIPVLNNVNNAIIAAVTPIRAFLTPIVESLQPLFENVFGVIGKLFRQAEEDTNSLADTIKGLTPIFSVLGNIVAFVIDIFGTGLGWVIETIGPFLKYIFLIIGAIKAWSIVQGILNAVMAINPIGAIIMAVVALIMLIGLLVKNWEKIGPAVMGAFQAIGDFFADIGQAIAGFFTWIWSKITDFLASVTAFVKKNMVNIVNVVLTILFPIAGIFMAVARLIIKHWDTIKAAIVKIVTAAVEKVKQVWGSIESFFHNLMANIRTIWQGVWNGILEFIGNLIEGIKADWQDFGFFLYGLWEGIKEGAAIIWEGIKGVFFGVIDGIKAAWQDFTGFFSSLWEAIRQGPAEAIEYIKSAFFGLFNSIQEKLFGFIGKIREGWDTVKGFFGNITGGVVNFFTGGDSGRGGGQMQPAYAGGTSQAAMAGAVGQTSNYAYTTMGGNSTVNAQTSINVNVPPGTSREQSEAIARQIDAQFDARLAGEINSSRSNIPSPEVRRH